MATQAKVTFSLQADHGNWKQQIAPGTLTITLATQGARAGTQTIGFAAAENLDYGDVAAASAGLLYLRNLDETNYVDWGMSDSGTMKAVGRLLPGEIAFVRVKPSAQVMMQAHTAAVNVEVLLLAN